MEGIFCCVQPVCYTNPLLFSSTIVECGFYDNLLNFSVLERSAYLRAAFI